MLSLYISIYLSLFVLTFSFFGSFLFLRLPLFDCRSTKCFKTPRKRRSSASPSPSFSRSSRQNGIPFPFFFALFPDCYLLLCGPGLVMLPHAFPHSNIARNRLMLADANDGVRLEALCKSCRSTESTRTTSSSTKFCSLIAPARYESTFPVTKECFSNSAVVD